MALSMPETGDTELNNQWGTQSKRKRGRNWFEKQGMGQGKKQDIPDTLPSPLPNKYYQTHVQTEKKPF